MNLNKKDMNNYFANYLNQINIHILKSAEQIISKKIKSKNQALLLMKHEHELVRFVCKKILKGEIKL